MALVGELLAGAVLGTQFSELYKGVKEMTGQIKSFKRNLDNLNSTLESLKPLIFEQIGELNVKLGLPTLEIEDLKRRMEDGAELVGRLSQIRRRDLFIKRSYYRKQLDELDGSLKRLLDILKVQEARDVKETLLAIRQQAATLLQVEELLKTLVETLKVMQEPRVAKETLFSAVQTSKKLVELEASTRQRLDKPVVQREAREVNDTEDFVRNTEMALKRIKDQNGVLKGAVLGTLFAEVYKGVKEATGQIKSFKRNLDNLNSTLESLKPLIFEQIEELNVKLGLPTLEIEDLKRKMKEGAGLVGRLSQIRRRDLLIKRSYYRKQLDELDGSLKRLLDILKVQEARDVKETLLAIRQQAATLLQVEELLKKLVETLKVMQEPRIAKETLFSAVQTSKKLVELEASTRQLLDKPAVQREARKVEDTEVFVRNTEMELKRIKDQNGVLKDMASLVQRTAVGTIIQELFHALYKVKDKPSKMDFLKPLIEDMKAKYNRVLDRPKEELENFKMLVEEALRLLRSKVRVWISYKTHKYGNELLAILDKSLQKLLDILKVQELSNVNETNLVSIRNIETLVQRLLDV